MTLKDRIMKDLYAGTNDPEAEHSDEDKALWAFVHAVAAEASEGSEIRAVALAMIAWDGKNEERTRWCA